MKPQNFEFIKNTETTDFLVFAANIDDNEHNFLTFVKIGLKTHYFELLKVALFFEDIDNLVIKISLMYYEFCKQTTLNMHSESIDSIVDDVFQDNSEVEVIMVYRLLADSFCELAETYELKYLDNYERKHFENTKEGLSYLQTSKKYTLMSERLERLFIKNKYKLPFKLGVFKNKIKVRDHFDEITGIKKWKIIPYEKDTLLKQKKTIVKPKLIAKTLDMIWSLDLDGSKSSYKEIITFLKKESIFTSNPFVEELNGALYWAKKPVKGWQQYLAGFIYTCIKNKWISDSYSAPKLVEIVNNTFNVMPNVKSFKSLSSNPPSDQYLKPFLKVKSITSSK